MADKNYALTEQAAQEVAEALRLLRQMRKNKGGYGPKPDVGRSNDTYAARLPSTGIPALESVYSPGTGELAGIQYVPGSAVCDIYQLSYRGGQRVLEPTGFTEEVFNLSTVALIGPQFISVSRDNYGAWLAAACAECNPSGTGVVPNPPDQGTGTGNIYTTCCLDAADIPIQLWLTLTDVDEAVVVELAHNELLSLWESVTGTGDISWHGLTGYYWTFQCAGIGVPSVFSWYFSQEHTIGSCSDQADPSANCNPLLVLFPACSAVVSSRIWWSIEAMAPYCFFGTETEAGTEAASAGATFTGPFPSNAACEAFVAPGTGTGTGGSGPAVLRFDNFNRPDEQPLGFPSDGGSAWVADASAGRVVSLRASSGIGASYASLEANTVDGEVNATMTVFIDGSGILARVTDDDNMIAMFGDATTGYHVEQFIGGVDVTLIPPTAPQPADGDIISLILIGSLVQMWVNGILIASATTSLLTGTRWGIAPSNTGSRIDDFNLSVPPTTVGRSDNFNRADESPLATPSDGGSNWVFGGAPYIGVLGNVAYAPAGGEPRSVLECGGINGTVSVRVSSVGSSSIAGLLLLYEGSNDYYQVHGTNLTAWKITKVVGGVPTALTGEVGGLPANGDVLSVTVSGGDTFELRVNGILLDTTVDPTPLTGTKHGIILSDTALLDDWSWVP